MNFHVRFETNWLLLFSSYSRAKNAALRRLRKDRDIAQQRMHKQVRTKFEKREKKNRLCMYM